MNFINKLTLQVFGLPNTLLVLQNCAILLTVSCLRVRALTVLSAQHSIILVEPPCIRLLPVQSMLCLLVQALNIVRFAPVHVQRAWALTPVTLLYVSNVGFALMSLQACPCNLHAGRVLSLPSLDMACHRMHCPRALRADRHAGCLQNLNIPMYNTLKRLTPVIILSIKARGMPRRDPGRHACPVMHDYLP
jgi:hypothetical protein